MRAVIQRLSQAVFPHHPRGGVRIGRPPLCRHALLLRCVYGPRFFDGVTFDAWYAKGPISINLIFLTLFF